MKLKWGNKVLVLVVCAILRLAAPSTLAAQEPGESTSRSPWECLKEGKISAEVRYRFEAFERDGAPFTAPAYAPTLKISLGYETPSLHGFSAFAQGVAILVTGPADYSMPTSLSQSRPDRPAILDPKSLELGQGYLRWTGGPQNKRLELTVGRQEIMLNDGRFITLSAWRQDHQTFDAVRLKAELPWDVSFNYAFLNRAHRVMGHDATDGKPPMHSHLLDLAWRKADEVNFSLYGALLGFRAPSDFNLATQTFGLRVTGPYLFNKNWGAGYTAEFANQKNFGNNPNRVNANYYLG
jgi:hypothetical protein